MKNTSLTLTLAATMVMPILLSATACNAKESALALWYNKPAKLLGYRSVAHRQRTLGC